MTQTQLIPDERVVKLKELDFCYQVENCDEAYKEGVSKGRLLSCGKTMYDGRNRKAFEEYVKETYGTDRILWLN